MHFFREFGWSLLTPRDDIVDSVVWFSGEYGQNESVVKMHSFEEHPGEHRQVRILHATDQQLAHHGLYTADTEWNLKRFKVIYIAHHLRSTERSVTCHTGSHSVTCRPHRTYVNNNVVG